MSCHTIFKSKHIVLIFDKKIYIFANKNAQMYVDHLIEIFNCQQFYEYFNKKISENKMCSFIFVWGGGGGVVYFNLYGLTLFE